MDMHPLSDEDIRRIAESAADEDGEIKPVLYEAVQELVTRNCALTARADEQTELMRKMRKEILRLRSQLKAYTN
jgi:pyruvate-formate lyase-activating enzyme